MQLDFFGRGVNRGHQGLDTYIRGKILLGGVENFFYVSPSSKHKKKYRMKKGGSPVRGVPM